MSDDINDPVLIAFAGGVMLLSAAVCFGLTVAWGRGKILRFVPRQLVPWNAGGAILAVLLVIITLLTAVAGLDKTAAPVKESPSVSSVHLIAGMAQEVFFVGGFLLFIAIYFKASRADLGLPSTRREFLYDVALGIFVGIATLAPVRIVQVIALKMSGAEQMQSGHPLVKMLTEGEVEIGVLVMASFAAVVIAPICEEVTFRLLLQGWLEKWEATSVGWDLLPVDVIAPEPTLATADGVNDETRLTNDPGAPGTNDESQFAESLPVESARTLLAVPPKTGIADLPFSWLPICLSSALFGIAHFGYGPEPIPLFFLALVLGYMYYRTHRIVPSIVAHAVFNLFTMVLLWRMVLQANH